VVRGPTPGIGPVRVLLLRSLAGVELQPEGKGVLVDDGEAGRLVRPSFSFFLQKKFKGKLIVQTLFVQGYNQHKGIDNSNEYEVNAWLHLLQEIQPESVILYPIEREIPENSIQKVDVQILNNIAKKVQAIGFKTEVFS